MDYGEVWDSIRHLGDDETRSDGDALLAAAVALRPAVFESMRARFERDFKDYMTTRRTLPDRMRAVCEHHTRLRRRLASAELAFVDHVVAALSMLEAGVVDGSRGETVVTAAVARVKELEAERTGSGWMLRLAAASAESAVADGTWSWPQSPAFGGQRRRPR